MAYFCTLATYQIEDVSVSIYEPDKTITQQQYQQRLISFPYWSQVWPAAIALARYLIRQPHYTQGKQVLELAAGLGLPAVVAARNAASVIAGDYEPTAVSIMQQTATYNHLQNMQVHLLDWYTLPAGLATDVLLLSDVSYDAALFEVQQKWIRKLLQQGSTVIISTPQRLVAKEVIRPLLSFCIYQEEVNVFHQNAEVPVTVMVLQIGDK